MKTGDGLRPGVGSGIMRSCVTGHRGAATASKNLVVGEIPWVLYNIDVPKQLDLRSPACSESSPRGKLAERGERAITSQGVHHRYPTFPV